MPLATTIGLVAAALTAIAFFPQVLKLLKTKKTRDISLGTFSILLTGNMLWLTYGFMVKDIPIIATNVVLFIFYVTIIILKMKYDKS